MSKRMAMMYQNSRLYEFTLLVVAGIATHLMR